MASSLTLWNTTPGIWKCPMPTSQKTNSAITLIMQIQQELKQDQRQKLCIRDLRCIALMDLVPWLVYLRRIHTSFPFSVFTFPFVNSVCHCLSPLISQRSTLNVNLSSFNFQPSAVFQARDFSNRVAMTSSQRIIASEIIKFIWILSADSRQGISNLCAFCVICVKHNFKP